MTLTTLETKNALNEETLEAVMIISVRPGKNEAKVRSDRPVPKVRALSEEVEPNKEFVKLLTLLLAQFCSAYQLKELIISQATS